MKNLGKATLGGFLALAIVGCGESGKFGDKEYTLNI
jgi:lipoprotein